MELPSGFPIATDLDGKSVWAKPHLPHPVPLPQRRQHSKCLVLELWESNLSPKEKAGWGLNRKCVLHIGISEDIRSGADSIGYGIRHRTWPAATTDTSCLLRKKTWPKKRMQVLLSKDRWGHTYYYYYYTLRSELKCQLDPYTNVYKTRQDYSNHMLSFSHEKEDPGITSIHSSSCIPLQLLALGAEGLHTLC